MSELDANEGIFDVLLDEIYNLERNGNRIAVWSNEWLVTRSRHSLPALRMLKARGIEIEIQCYVRRHDEWVQSAYLQWGMKHKAYEGPLREFKDWLPIFGERELRFAPSLQIWDHEFGSQLKVFNYDAAGDVVQHFLRVNDISGLTAINDNVTPAPEMLAAQAVFNSRNMRHVFPVEFESVRRLVKQSDENRVTLPPLDHLTANVETLMKIVASRQDDIEEINRFLLRSGEPLLSFDKPVQQARHPSPWEMDQLILKLVYSVVEEFTQLKGQVAAIQAKLDAQKDDKAH